MAKKKRKKKKKFKIKFPKLPKFLKFPRFFKLSKPLKWLFFAISSLISMGIGFSFDRAGKIVETQIINSIGNSVNNIIGIDIVKNVENSVKNTVNKSVETVENIVGKNNNENIINKIIPTEKNEYKVLYVSDGDTIAVKKIEKKVITGELLKVRLFGIDAPETKQDYGYESKMALMSMIKDKNIKLEIKNKDKYGRLVGIVYCDGKNINEEMVKGGHAWWYKQYDKNNETLKKYEEEAKRKKIGLFAKKGYIEPWNFRKNKK